ncbi:hypothetical protein L209DRAFT_754328 [Thermothelomyces heterothallicus CBS 203.75]
MLSRELKVSPPEFPLISVGTLQKQQQSLIPMHGREDFWSGKGGVLRYLRYPLKGGLISLMTLPLVLLYESWPLLILIEDLMLASFTSRAPIATPGRATPVQVHSLQRLPRTLQRTMSCKILHSKPPHTGCIPDLYHRLELASCIGAAGLQF